ncbi:F0F1 ATP synthase subunit alpha [Candidatus Gottesmanbacteria bacterium RBG_13_37_7]|uniref:ATP synthase subunit alpha n=1 Tax=Candidatus Gottesmanbacteria bacterium RBG_13_37_7 TaxID=1798369 RepID=A0A1F5YIB9_9BACT|nr:MAG: F0F1 ATP synthase subunit alpha [Candidatus Gottesmanbacteria bacterium RBG_13_37_7]
MAKVFSPEKISEQLVKKLKSYTPKIDVGYSGKVLKVADGVARISGLQDIALSEMVEFEKGIFGVAINLEEEEVGAIIMGDYLKIKEGDLVKSTGRLLSIGVSDQLVGRVLDPLGNPLDGKGKVESKSFYPVEKIAPGVVQRRSVNVPLQTGIKAIDSMVPIGRGQRELIIGDRSTGKTALVIDTIINQKNEDVICIYVAIGQKASRVAQIINELKKHKALDHTIIIAACASDSATLQFLAPYVGCAIGEYFMDKGRDALVIYDDLTKHAWSYREISLVLRRPSGREAYPGDVFYLHSRLLERACKLDDKYGGGSLTALPIIETQAGDLSSYIPTNVISITDGQIYLESDLFYAGVRPAINAGLSVSRVGGAAQIKAMKQVAGRLRMDLAQYRELAAFAQFASDLDEKTKSQIERGSRMVEILKQKQYMPIPVEKQVCLLFAASEGFLDQIALTKIAEYEDNLYDCLETVGRKLLSQIKKEKKITDEAAKELKKILTEFQKKL